MAYVNSQVTCEGRLDTLNFRMQILVQATAASTLTLTTTSPGHTEFTGTTAGQIIDLGVATTYLNGHEWHVYNESTQTISVRDNGATVLATLQPKQRCKAVLQSNSTAAGIWIISEITERATAVGSILVALFADTTNAVSNKFLSTENINTSDNQPSVMPAASAVRTVTYSGNQDDATASIEFRVNTTGGAAALTCTLATGVGNTTQVFTGLNLVVAAGDRINCKIASGASRVAKPLVKCYF